MVGEARSAISLAAPPFSPNPARFACDGHGGAPRGRAPAARGRACPGRRGVEPLVARLREQRPDLDAGAEQVGEALRALEAEESEAAAAAAPAAAADECASGAASLGASLACVGCGVQPWQVEEEVLVFVCFMCSAVSAVLTIGSCVEWGVVAFDTTARSASNIWKTTTTRQYCAAPKVAIEPSCKSFTRQIARQAISVSIFRVIAAQKGHH